MLLRRGRKAAAEGAEASTQPAPPRDRTRRIALIVAILCVATLVGGTTAAFANDAFARAHLLPGTRIGGIDLGGKPLTEAEQKLTSTFVEPLHQPMVVTASDVSTETTPWELGMRVDVRQVMQETYERQQQMTLWQRISAWVRGVH